MNNDNNINDLNKDPGKGFGVPEGYFESFNSRLMARIQMEEELKAYPNLSALEKKNCFEVPENYFETRNFVQAALNAEDEKEAVVVRLSAYIRKYGLSIAAMLIIVLGTAIYFKAYNKTEVKVTDCAELACLSKEDITSSRYFEQISIDELETVASTTMLDSIGTQMNKEILDEIMADPDAMNITDEDLGI